MPAIGAIGSYGSIGGCYPIYQNRYARSGGPAGTEPVGPVSRVQTAPVPPVDRASAVHRGSSEPALAKEASQALFPTLREGADPAEMAVRARIVEWDGEEEEGPLSRQAPEEDGEKAKSPREVMEESECQTCKRRKYQDGSDDPGVSFKTATHIAPEQAASAVRGHEQEHVVREQAKARREDRKVVSQSVTIHTAICPECGEVYVSGGTTRTATKADPVQEDQPEEESSGSQAAA